MGFGGKEKPSRKSRMPAMFKSIGAILSSVGATGYFQFLNGMNDSSSFIVVPVLSVSKGRFNQQ